ncbi:copper resistance system multicopper oxidase [soil metagenome]
MSDSSTFDRRSFLMGAAAIGGAAAFAPLLPVWAQSGTRGLKPDTPTLSGEDIALKIGHRPFTVGGRTGQAITINETLPAPLLRLHEGQHVRLAVTNDLEEPSSIHWHGILLPFQMDGVPGLSFPGIRPRETFVYEFPIRQAGTFWYHSHSGLQEQLGHYGPIVIDPADPDPVVYDREHVLVLSDWSFMHPHTIMRKLKAQSDYFNRQELTLAGLIRTGDQEQQMSLDDRLMWDGMRMDPTDIADITGLTYTYLVNGHGPEENWTGLFRPGERVRLRFINASAMSVFHVRIPGLPMTVVQADGENVRPVAVDEFQISVAETYDVIVEPIEDRAFTIVAESVDRSGMGRATLAPRTGMTADVPPLRPRPTLGMDDMGMAGMSEMSGMDHGAMGHGRAMSGTSGMEHGDMEMRNPANAPPDMAVGAGVDMIAPMPMDRTGHPGLGLTDVGHRVLTYRDLVSLEPNPDTRQPSRAIEIHLTGNMERFMWSFDGRKFSEIVEPVRLARNERVRVTLVNDTMMQHPIHLHGHFFEVVNGHPGQHPRKHTVNVLPGSKVSFDLTADNPGDWAFHCHLLFHMHAGMFNVFTVRPLERVDA